MGVSSPSFGGQLLKARVRVRAIRAVLGRPIGSTPGLEPFMGETLEVSCRVLTRMGERDVAADRRRATT